MARTYRNVPDWIYSGLVTEFEWHLKSVRVENRKARDGSGHHYICGSAKEGVLNSRHDVGEGYGKRTGNKSVRRWHRKVTRSRLCEWLDDRRLDVEEAQDQEFWDSEECFYDEDDDYWEEVSREVCEAEAEERNRREANLEHSWDGLDMDDDWD